MKVAVLKESIETLYDIKYDAIHKRTKKKKYVIYTTS